MATIARITNWIANQILKSSDLNNEFNNIINAWNNIDAGTSSWTNTKSATINATGTFQKNGVTAPPILQIVQGTTTTQTSTSSASYVVTSLTASITPNATTSKIFVFYSGSMGNGSGTAYSGVFRGSTNISGSSTSLAFSAGSSTTSHHCGHYVDSPSSVAALTYTVEILSSSGTITFGGGSPVQEQVIILVEIGA